MQLCLIGRGIVGNAPSGFVRATCDLAAALAAAGHQVELLTDLAPDPAPALPGVSTRRLPVVPLADPPADTSPDSALDNLMHAAALYREVRRIHELEHPVDAVIAPLRPSSAALCVLDERFPTLVSGITSLSTALEHEVLRRGRLVNGGRAHEQRFEPQVVARQMLAFIDRIVKQNAGGAERHDVRPELEHLLRDVLAIDAVTAAELATELLDPVTAGSLRRLRDRARAGSPRSNGRTHARVTAVVLTQNRPELLRGALDSLADTSVQPDVIVIDDASDPEAARRVTAECAGRPRVRLQRSDQPQGCAAGRRLGTELAEGELILFLDDDAELMPGALEHLCAELEAHPQADAVTATVVSSDGRILHSGGSVSVRDGVASYALIGADAPIADSGLPPSGTVAWVPGTAALIRREVLEEFPIDERMIGYYEDNEWSYRVRAHRDGEFRRSLEALVLHHLVPKRFDWEDPQTRARWAAWLASHARFYERHGVLMAPWLFDLVPEMRATDGSCDYAGARLLLELTIAKGARWVATARANGELDDFLNARRNRLDRAELASLRTAVGPDGETLAYLRRRDATLSAIEQGGWWRLRTGMLPLLRAVSKLRGDQHAD